VRERRVLAACAGGQNIFFRPRRIEELFDLFELARRQLSAMKAFDRHSASIAKPCGHELVKELLDPPGRKKMFWPPAHAAKTLLSLTKFQKLGEILSHIIHFSAAC